MASSSSAAPSSAAARRFVGERSRCSEGLRSRTAYAAAAATKLAVQEACKECKSLLAGRFGKEAVASLSSEDSGCKTCFQICVTYFGKADSLTKSEATASLFAAMKAGLEDVALALLDRYEIDVDAVDGEEGPPLIYVACEARHTRVIGELAKRGANLNVEVSAPKSMMHCRSVIVREEVWRKWLPIRVDGPVSLLLRAAWEGWSESVEALLKSGRVDVGQTDKLTKWSSVAIACVRRDAGLLKVLRAAGASMKQRFVRRAYWEYPSEQLCAFPEWEIRPGESTRQSDTTPLDHALSARWVEGVEEILESEEVDLNQGVGPEGKPLICMAAETGCPRMVEFLLSCGAEANAVDKEGTTALGYACSWSEKASLHERIETACILLNAGAGPLGFLSEDQLRLIEEANQLDQESIEGMLSTGLIRSRLGGPLKGVSWDSPEVKEALLEERRRRHRLGAVRFAFSCSQQIVEELFKRIHFPELTRSDREELVCAVIGNDRQWSLIDKLKFLEGHGVGLPQRFEDGSSPLHEAVGAPYQNCCEKRFMQYLIGKGADVEARDWEGNTPLHLALKKNCWSNDMTEVVEVLISKTQDSSARNNEGETFRDLAEKHPGLPEAVKELIRKMK